MQQVKVDLKKCVNQKKSLPLPLVKETLQNCLPVENKKNDHFPHHLQVWKVH